MYFDTNKAKTCLAAGKKSATKRCWWRSKNKFAKSKFYLKVNSI